ncbi:MAG: UbiA family prenyltransferase [Rubrobacteridae bacterium]|nr:UbiA family prenyltransferase [Rubrobacteridae bacterium]
MDMSKRIGSIKEISVFVKERYPLKVTIPLSCILFFAPFFLGYTKQIHLVDWGLFDLKAVNISPLDMKIVIAGWFILFMSLLCLRIADDLSDIEKDRKDNKDRALVTGRTSKSSITVFLIISLAMIVVMCFFIYFQTGSLVGISLAIGTISFYLLFFIKLKKSISILVRSFLSNLFFFLLPVCVTTLFSGTMIDNEHIYLGMFIYLAVVAHEWAHNVGADDEPVQSGEYSKLIGARKSAVVASILFLLSMLSGWIFWHVSGTPMVFGLLLAGTSCHLLLKCIGLIKHPSCRYARPFYIYGFTFFLIPLIGLLIDSLNYIAFHNAC